MSDITRSNDEVAAVRASSAPATHKQTDDAVQMRRGLSKAYINRSVVSRARKLVLSDVIVCPSSEPEDQSLHVAETPVFTFVLPNINIYPDGFKAFLYKELIESPTLVSLEQGGFLNWWADVEIGPRLYPLQTSGDGNCLLHAASLAMWGFHDRQLLLRKLLASNMSGGRATDAFRRRWRWQQTASNKQCGLVYNEEEWEREWQYIVSLADWQPKNQSNTTTAVSNNRSHAGKLMDAETVFESLEELHVFIVAHVLRRPVIVIAKSVLTDLDGEALAPIPFGGIYLPLECAPSDCHRSPLLLTYNAAHFSALVWMDSEAAELAIPLVNPQLDLLPLHFATDPGPDYDWQHADDCTDFDLPLDKKVRLLENYMDVKVSKLGNVKQAEPFDRLTHKRGSSLDSAQITSRAGRLADEMKPDLVDVSRQRQSGVVKAFGSLGQSVSQTLKSITHGLKINKSSVGTATQSSRTNTSAARMLSNQHQVLCAVLSQRRMSHQDELVRNYLDQASQRYAELRLQHHRQSDELERRLSPSARMAKTQGPRTTRTMPVPQHLPAPSFERKNTLLLTGKSKFYTMSYEDHCQSPPPSRDEQPTTTERYHTLATDILPGYRPEDRVKAVGVMRSKNKNDVRKTKSVVENLQYSISEDARKCDGSDTNHNSIFWPGESHCVGADSCLNPVLPHTGNLCAACFHAKRYSSVVHYPTSMTKL